MAGLNSDPRKGGVTKRAQCDRLTVEWGFGVAVGLR